LRPLKNTADAMSLADLSYARVLIYNSREFFSYKSGSAIKTMVLQP